MGILKKIPLDHTDPLRCTSFCGCNDDGVFCSRFQDIADVSPDAYADIGNIIDNSNSDSEDDFDDF